MLFNGKTTDFHKYVRSEVLLAARKIQFSWDMMLHHRLLGSHIMRRLRGLLFQLLKTRPLHCLKLLGTK